MLAVLNAETLAVSEYSLTWKDVAVVDGVVYGLTSTALVKLSGAIEASAVPTLTTGALDLAPGDLVNVGAATLTLQAAGALTLTAVADCQGAAETHGYPVPARPSTAARRRAVRLGDRPTGPAWSFTLAGSGTWACSAWSIETNRDRLYRVTR